MFSLLIYNLMFSKMHRSIIPTVLFKLITTFINTGIAQPYLDATRDKRPLFCPITKLSP